MNPTETNCHSIDVLGEKLRSERELREALVKLLDERDRANKEAIRAAFASAEKASEKTDTALKEYKLGSNEWRATLNDIVARMVTRVDFESHLKSLESKIADLREYRSGQGGREQNKTAVWAVILMFIPWVLTVILFFIKKP